MPLMQLAAKLATGSLDLETDIEEIELSPADVLALKEEGGK